MRTRRNKARVNPSKKARKLRSVRRKPAREQLLAVLRANLVLTKGEMLWLRRMRSGRTWKQHARAMVVSEWAVRRWEQGIGELPDVAPLTADDLSFRELTAIHRRRRGIHMRELRDVFDKSLGWVHTACTGVSRRAAARVVDYILAS